MKFLIFLFSFFMSVSVSLAEEKLRVISLAPHLTEIVFALHKEALLVGNTTACDYPEAAKKIPKIGDYISPSLELILQSKANLILATEGNSRETIEKIKKYGKRVVEVDPQTVEDLPKSIEQVASALGAQADGKILSQKVSDSLKSLTPKSGPKKKALIALQFSPVYSVSEKTWIGDIFRLAGYENIAKGTLTKYPVLSAEHIVKEKPDVIFVFSELNKTSVDAEVEKLFSHSKNRPEIVMVPKDILVRPGPRVIEGVEFLKTFEQKK